MARKRILVVDDDATALGALRQILSQRGYDVATAADGEDALKQLAAEPFDLVLLDVILPGLSGYDVCRRLRAEPRTRDLPVVFLTARGDMADMRQAQSAGSDLYLVKPVSATRLANMVAMFLSPDAPLARRTRANPGA